MQGVSKMRLQTKACIAGLKTILMFFNILFWASGIILVTIGLWMKFSLGKYLEIDTNYTHFTLPGLFAFSGVVVIVVSFLACSCTTKGQTGPLYAYSIFLAIAFLVVFSGALAGYVYRGKLDETFRTGLTKATESYGSKDLLTKDMDRLQGLLECCGVNNYTDYFATSWANGTNIVPGSCCRQAANCPPRADVTDERLDAGQIYQDGCYNHIVDFLSGKFQTIGCMALLCAFLQLFGAINSCLLAKFINKAVYETLA